MPTIETGVLALLTAGLVFAAGWRMQGPQTPAAGGATAFLLFLLHPALSFALSSSSARDAVFVMLFVSAWLWVEHWSVFMRSCALAAIYAFGLWIASPFVLWGLAAMVPWVLFNRRPLVAVGSLLIVLLGGLTLFAVTWGGSWVLLPAAGQAIFTSWVRWKGAAVPPAVSLPWLLLAAGAVLERVWEMLKTRRADASIFAAVLFVIAALCVLPESSLTLIALSAPLIARSLAKKEFLYLRRIRWVAAAAFGTTLLFGMALPSKPWMATGVAMVMIGLASRFFYRRSRLLDYPMGEAVCLGAYVAETAGMLAHRWGA